MWRACELESDCVVYRTFLGSWTRRLVASTQHCPVQGTVLLRLRESLSPRLRVAYVSYRPIDVLRGTGVVTSLWQLYGFSICSLRIEF